MPVSLDPLESQSNEPTKIITSVIRRTKKTTKTMVEDALTELHNVKGVTLKQVYDFILDNNNLESLSKYRIALIKKKLKSLHETGEVVNKTGKGLIGHFKLADKANFLKKNRKNNEQFKENITTIKRAKAATVKESNSKKSVIIKNKRNIRRTIKKLGISSKQIEPVIPKQVTPFPLRNNNVSMFDTPMVATQVRTSTPLVSPLIPWAPEARKRAFNEELPDDRSDTPRSSLPIKKRKLLKRAEKVY